MTNFISVYDKVLTKKECDSIIEWFEKNPFKDSGKIWGVPPGEDPKKALPRKIIQKDVKDSTDLGLCFDQVVFDAVKTIGNVIYVYTSKYVEENPLLNQIEPWRLQNTFNIQKYLPGQGYHATHCEAGTTSTSSRVMAWTLYLNTVTDKGGTHFPQHDLTIDAKAGRFVIWPAYWTHCHNGVSSPTQTKYIATGWYIFDSSPLGQDTI